ncbi:Cysteine-rich protein 1 [Anas platyrhynchos]|uniref:Cysteine-rich protein 1 n=1 Tax=Anas platyrhynchos TaxID=8839 RepID=R0JEW9_ANAPL|nr:Cysteine-rich protein 1 [Anas platyrhynchos]
MAPGLPRDIWVRPPLPPLHCCLAPCADVGRVEMAKSCLEDGQQSVCLCGHSGDPMCHAACSGEGSPRCPARGLASGHLDVRAEKVTSLGKDWHRPCLRCEKCNKTLTSGGHAEHDGKPYCNHPCYAALFGPKGFGRGGAESHTFK